MKISLVTGISGDQLHYRLARIKDKTKEFSISSIVFTNIRDMSTRTIVLLHQSVVLMLTRMSNSKQHSAWNAFENVSKVKTNASQSEGFTNSDEEEYVIDSDDDDLHYDI